MANESGAPPIDTAQVIEPSLYFHRVEPRHVSAPAVTNRVGTTGSLDDLRVSVTLTGGAFDLSRRGYLRGWAGDTYVDNREGKRRCVHDHLALRSPSDTTAALNRFRAWAGGAPGRSVSQLGPDSLAFTVCH